MLAGICDVDDAVLAKGRDAATKAGLKVEEYKDYRKMLESKNIDAVLIATPNHQHSIMTILALQAGKDVYVEKPLSHNIWEGRQAVEAAKKYTKNIALIGTQNRSSEQIMNAISYLRAGKLGKKSGEGFYKWDPNTVDRRMLKYTQLLEDALRRVKRVGEPTARYSMPFTMSSTTFLASPKTIIVLSM